MYLGLIRLIPDSVVIPEAVSEEEDAARLVRLVEEHQRRTGAATTPVISYATGTPVPIPSPAGDDEAAVGRSETNLANPTS